MWAEQRPRRGSTVLAWGLGLAPALLWGWYARQPALTWLPFVALVPWVLLAERRQRWAGWLAPYAVGVGGGWMLIYFQAAGYGWYAPPLFALFGGWAWLPFLPALRAIDRAFALPRALSVPLVWVAVEWLRVQFTLGHFDLYLLGYSQAERPLLIQIADVTGVYGVSFLVASVSGLLADLSTAVGRRAVTTRLLLSLLLVVSLFGVTIAYGATSLARDDTGPGPRLAVVQPNLLHRASNHAGVHLGQLLLSDRDIDPHTAELIVWPENAILADLRRRPDYVDDLAWLASRKQAALLVGAPDFAVQPPGSHTNAAWLFDSRGQLLGTAHKRILFPWSEYVPGDRWLGRVSSGLQRTHRSLVRRGWGFVPAGIPGRETVLLRLPWNGAVIPFATLICLENAYPPLVAEATRNGAAFLINITSEGEVGGTVQRQLLRICMLRAVENRRAYVRAGNTGISCFIDPWGRLQSVLRGKRGETIFDAGVLLDRVALARGGPTLYARSRDAFAKGCLAVSAVLLVTLAATLRRRASTGTEETP